MAFGKQGTDIAIEELSLAHQGLPSGATTAQSVDGSDFLVWQRLAGTQAAKEDAEVDGADFLAWQREAGVHAPDGLVPSGDIHPNTLAGDYGADGDVDGRDFQMWQRGSKVVEPESEGFAVVERIGSPEAESLKAGASEVLMESLVSPRDPATGQAAGYATDNDDPGPSILVGLSGETTADLGSGDVFDAAMDVDLDFDV